MSGRKKHLFDFHEIAIFVSRLKIDALSPTEIGSLTVVQMLYENPGLIF